MRKKAKTKDKKNKAKHKNNKKKSMNTRKKEIVNVQRVLKETYICQ